jgi:predicted SAM-dependent methyltransferase
MKLNLGSGHHKLEGFKTVDKRQSVNPDYLADLEKDDCLKDIPDNSVDEIVSSKTFEHITNLDGLLKEVYRVCKNGAIVRVIVPYYSSQSSYNDPDHKRFFTENWGVYLNKESKGSDRELIDIDYDFVTDSVKLICENEYKGLSVEEILKLSKKYLNVISFLEFTLIVKKYGEN